MRAWFGIRSAGAVSRRHPYGMRLMAVLAVLAVGILVGLRALSRPPAPVGAIERSAEQVLAEGDQRLARRDYRGALAAYDEGLERFPYDLRLLYRAGVALSFLGDREQAALVFRSVVRRGDPASPEVRAAQAWLAGTTSRPGS
ncbi:MAG TPA: tetratricopeptide repeat protein [Candidatus Binatia bacterium]|nr:tetratricopeptide repeat protein [Candidatus Binatia bacterium]